MDPNHHHHHHHNLTINASSSSSSSSYHMFSLEDDQEVAYARRPFIIKSKPLSHTHEVVEDVAMERKKENNGLKHTNLTGYNQDYYYYHNSSNPSTPLKMRLFQKTMKSNEDQESKQLHCPSGESCGENRINKNDSCGLIRACVDCGTTRTPLWRSGPNGPKSLCNACGIRQRKARRASMAASESARATNSNNSRTASTSNKLNTEMRAPKKMKKRSKNHANSMPHDHHLLHQTTQTKRICFQEFAMELSNKLSLHQFFPQDEKEAAVLLMALSCGFVEE